MIRVVDRYQDFLTLKDAWNEVLTSSSESDNVFLRHEWFDVWWQAFGTHKQLLIQLCYDNKDLIGIIPLMMFRDRYKGIPYKRIGFIEDPNAPSMNFIAQGGYEKSVVERVLGALLHHPEKAWHAAILNKIPRASTTINWIRDYTGSHQVCFILREGMSSPYIPTIGDWEGFLKATAVRFRKQLRNKMNRLSRAGQVDFELWTDCGTHRQHLEEAMSVSSRSWKSASHTTMCGTPERRKFFELLSDLASREGWLWIWLLRLNGKAIATEYHLHYKRKTHAMRGDFDAAYEALSPGSILEAHIIEHCFKNQLLEYDFCGLPYGYKMQWTSLLHDRTNVLLYNSSLYSLGLYGLQKYLPMLNSALSARLVRGSSSSTSLG